MKITFVRHTAVDVPPGVCYGQTDVGLRDTFPEEAETVHNNLEKIKMETGKDFDAIYRSPLSRCRRLADACGYKDAVPDPRILEMNFGEWEMKKFDDIRDPHLQEWYDDWQHVRATGGESIMDQHDRVRDFIEAMKSSGHNDILVFTHAGVIMNAMLMSGVATPDTIFAKQPPYGGIVTLEFS